MGQVTWWVDGKMKYTTPGRPGDTKSLNDGKRAAISINPLAFTDARILYTVVTHELVHANDILNGNEFQWIVDFSSSDRDVIMAYHGYKRSAEIEAGFGVNYGSAAAMQRLEPFLPAGFSFNNYNK